MHFQTKFIIFHKPVPSQLSATYLATQQIKF